MKEGLIAAMILMLLVVMGAAGVLYKDMQALNETVISLDSQVDRMDDQCRDAINLFEFYDGSPRPPSHKEDSLTYQADLKRRRPVCIRYCEKIVNWMEKCKDLKLPVSECIQPMPAEMLCLEAMMRLDGKIARHKNLCDVVPYFPWNKT